jgi:site-specific DNA-methyltransferase (adenine-specific)
MLSFPNKKYNIIYADPPWQYKESWGNGQVGYGTMKTEDICTLPVSEITGDQAHLYLWVTNPFICEGLEVCKNWGFDYKTLITWIKTYKDGTPEMGMGYYFRGCTEHIIFGVKGKMKCRNKITRNMFYAVNSRNHSQKPECARDMIVKSSGDIPRIELFAREEIEGWDCWGNDTKKFNKKIVQKELLFNELL